MSGVFIIIIISISIILFHWHECKHPEKKNMLVCVCVCVCASVCASVCVCVACVLACLPACLPARVCGPSLALSGFPLARICASVCVREQQSFDLSCSRVSAEHNTTCTKSIGFVRPSSAHNCVLTGLEGWHRTLKMSLQALAPMDFSSRTTLARFVPDSDCPHTTWLYFPPQSTPAECSALDFRNGHLQHLGDKGTLCVQAPAP